MPTHEQIYANQAEAYEAMISRQPDLSGVVGEIRPYRDLDILDLGAGTGRLSAFLARQAKSLICTDASSAMLDMLEQRLTQQGLPRNWKTCVADHRSLPLPDASVDLVVSGWSICYLAHTSNQNGQENLEAVMGEIGRVLRQDGTIILFETMGTGTLTPQPPEFLKPYYSLLGSRYGFAHRQIRMDYRFESPAEAQRHMAFFFGDDLARNIEEQQWATVPEWAGVWWRQG